MTEVINKPSVQNRWRVTVSLDGTPTGVWDKMTGGNRDSDDPTYPPGGMGEPIALGGRSWTEPVTVSRIYDLERDHSLIATLHARTGKGWVVVTKQPLDEDGNAYGEPIVRAGKLKSVVEPDVDSESSDPSMLEIEVTSPGTPA